MRCGHHLVVLLVIVLSTGVFLPSRCLVFAFALVVADDAETALELPSTVSLESSQVAALLRLTDYWSGLRRLTSGAWTRDNLESLPCNSFGTVHGVLCDEHGMVTQLWLTDASLPASIMPDVLADLTELSHMSIACDVVGTLPSSLGSLSKLQILQLPNSKIEGSIPESWSRLMTTLQILELHWNEGGGPHDWDHNLFSSTASSPPMQQLILSGFNFGRKTPLPQELFELPALRELTLEESTFDGEVPSIFFDSLLETSTQVSNPVIHDNPVNYGLEKDGTVKDVIQVKVPKIEAWKQKSLLSRLVISGSPDTLSRTSLARPLPPTWTALPASLTFLSLQGLPWNGSLPAATSRGLQHLSIRHFPNLCGSIPDSLLDSPTLITLELEGMPNVTGSVPVPSNFKVSAIRALTLHAMGLNGTLNASLLSSPSLVKLSISDMHQMKRQMLPSARNGACPKLQHLTLYVAFLNREMVILNSKKEPVLALFFCFDFARPSLESFSDPNIC